MVCQKSPFHRYSLYLLNQVRTPDFAHICEISEFAEAFVFSFETPGIRECLFLFGFWLQAQSQVYLAPAEPLNPAMPPEHKSNFLKTQVRGKINRALPSSTNFQSLGKNHFCNRHSVSQQIKFWTFTENWLGRTEGEQIFRAEKEEERSLKTCICSKWCKGQRQEGRGRPRRGESQTQQRFRSPAT